MIERAGDDSGRKGKARSDDRQRLYEGRRTTSRPSARADGEVARRAREGRGQTHHSPPGGDSCNPLSDDSLLVSLSTSVSRHVLKAWSASACSGRQSARKTREASCVSSGERLWGREAGRGTHRPARWPPRPTPTRARGRSRATRPSSPRPAAGRRRRGCAPCRSGTANWRRGGVGDRARASATASLEVARAATTAAKGKGHTMHSDVM